MTTIYNIECNRNDGLGWVQDGCWGGEYANGLSKSDAITCIEHLQELYPDVDWRMTEEKAAARRWKAVEPCTGHVVRVECVETGEQAHAAVRWVRTRPSLYGSPFVMTERTEDNPEGRVRIAGPYKYV